MIGRKLRNRYEITEHLGDGSTATVYKARDTRLNRDVAIKMLLPHVRDSTRKRFFQEATSAAALNHPNVMAIYDIDEEGGRNFLVIEFIEGVSLSHYVPSSPELVVDLGSQIARALQYAHEAQIIHRDIKPANIQVTPDGQVKLMDLGLALPHDAKRVTAHGMVIGTPAYLSPEQAQGLKLDHRTDIYSLGIVLYELATGQLPFNADDIGALLLQQVKQAPPPPRLVNADLPLALEAVILKSLEKNPNRRYQSASAMASALEVALPMQQGEAPDTSAEGAKSTMQAERPPTLGTDSRTRMQRRTLRIILADDHVLLRKSLSGLLEQHDEFVVVGEASDGAAALEQTINIQPDLLVLDLNMPGRGGLDILPEVRERAPAVKVLVLTGREEESYIMRAIRAGAHGYILKSSGEDDLLDAITKVTQGQMVLGPGVAEVVTGMLSGDSNKLNDTEQRVILHVAAGYENSDIGRLLNIPMPEMVEVLARAMDKLDARDRHSAALKALKNGDIMIEDVHALGGPDEIR